MEEWQHCDDILRRPSARPQNCMMRLICRTPKGSKAQLLSSKIEPIQRAQSARRAECRNAYDALHETSLSARYSKQNTRTKTLRFTDFPLYRTPIAFAHLGRVCVTSISQGRACHLADTSLYFPIFHGDVIPLLCFSISFSLWLLCCFCLCSLKRSGTSLCFTFITAKYTYFYIHCYANENSE